MSSYGEALRNSRRVLLAALLTATAAAHYQDRHDALTEGVEHATQRVDEASRNAAAQFDVTEDATIETPIGSEWVSFNVVWVLRSNFTLLDALVYMEARKEGPVSTRFEPLQLRQRDRALYNEFRERFQQADRGALQLKSMKVAVELLEPYDIASIHVVWQIRDGIDVWEAALPYRVRCEGLRQIKEECLRDAPSGLTALDWAYLSRLEFPNAQGELARTLGESDRATFFGHPMSFRLVGAAILVLALAQALYLGALVRDMEVLEGEARVNLLSFASLALSSGGARRSVYLGAIALAWGTTAGLSAHLLSAGPISVTLASGVTLVSHWFVGRGLHLSLIHI